MLPHSLGGCRSILDWVPVAPFRHREDAFDGFGFKLGCVRGVSRLVPLADHAEGAALLALVRRGDAIVTLKLDRMFRSALDVLDVLSQLRDRRMVELGGEVATNRAILAASPLSAGGWATMARWCRCSKRPWPGYGRCGPRAGAP